jgi:pimeloyl-ACP methyl ester carboxylesterase
MTEDIASPSETFSSLLAAQTPDEEPRSTLWALYQPLRDWLTAQEDLAPNLATASIFTTQDPVSELFKLRDFVHTLPPPTARDIESLGVQRAINNYEVFVGRYTAPRFQSGEIPYKTSGGGITFVDDLPQVQGEEDLRFSIAVPEGEMPEGGWPIVLYAHGTGGNYQSYYRGEIGLSLAKKGLAVISIDQIHHGDRDGGLCDGGVDYSQCVSLLFFNFLIPKAGRDNVRQSAIDYVSLMRMVQGLELPAEISELGVTSRFNPNKIMFMGHSQGGLNGPLFMAIEPQIIGGVLSGAGSNIAISLEQKTRPFNVNQLVQIALGLNVSEPLDRWHPALSLLQMFIEPGDSSNFASYWFHRPPEGYSPKSVLMTVGLRDEYTPPDTTFALAVAGRVPLIEPIAQPIEALDFLGIGSAGIPPISANVASGEVTAGLAQYEREGHFVIFDLPSAKERYSRFLQELAQRPPPTIY